MLLSVLIPVYNERDTIDELLTNRDLVIHIGGVKPEHIEKFRTAELVVEDQVEDRARVRVVNDASPYNVLNLCRELDVTLISVAPRRETLEELFVRVIGAARSAKEGA